MMSSLESGFAFVVTEFVSGVLTEEGWRKYCFSFVLLICLFFL
jgi:hypothetical protein